MLVNLLITGLFQSLILALVTYALMIPFRLLNLTDLTAEGAYPLAGAVSACLLIAGYSPLIAILGGAISAGCLGICTGLLYLRFNINNLLTGIILSMMIYSVNLRIMGKPNIALFEHVINITDSRAYFLVGLLILVFSIIIILNLFLKTELGLRLRSVGFNIDFAKRHGINITGYTILGLFIAGCLSGLAGSLMIQLQAYMDIGMGIGIVINALAALMIGEKIVGNHTLNRQLLAPLVGAIIYQQVQGMALFLGLAPSDLKFFTGALVLFIMALQKKGMNSPARSLHA